MRLVFVLLLFCKFTLAQEYLIDNAHSSVSFLIKHLSVANTMGIFENFSGNVSIDNGKLTKLSGKVKVDSINTFNSSRDSNLTSDKGFFSTNDATLELIKTNNDHIKARLTINGISKDVDFLTTITGPIKNPNLAKTQKASNDHNNLLINGATKANNILTNEKAEDDCGCYVTYGDNVIGVELRGRINRFDFNISKTTPKELLGEYIDIQIILEASN